MSFCRSGNTRCFRIRVFSREAAEEKAHAEYEIYNRTQPIESDFDHFLELEAEVKKGEEK